MTTSGAHARLRLIDYLRTSALDVRLALRMLVKYPGLSIVAVLGMAVAIAIGAGFFGFLSSMYDPTLPLEQSERIMAIENFDIRRGGHRESPRDFGLWRDELRDVRDLAAFTVDRTNLIVPGQAIEPVTVARMTASGFRVTRTAPFLGRSVLEADEQPGASPVVLVAYEEWQRRFGGDRSAVGRQVRLGGEVHTIIGVMPAGFHFPINHSYWTALRVPVENGADGPSLFVFGRLADGVDVEQVQSKLAVLGTRLATTFPETHRDLRPRMLPYAYAVNGLSGQGTSERTTVQLLVSLLLVIVAVNVAVVVYARTASRAGEIAVRTALGASRSRVVTQLFAEAFVLSGTAAMLGLLIAALALDQLATILQARGDGLPYWITFGLSPSLVFYVAGLAIVGAVVVGVLPALQATGGRLQSGLQQLSARGSQMRLGRTWTTLIILQVAVAVAIMPLAVDLSARTAVTGISKVRYPTEEHLRASLAPSREEMTAATDTATYRRDRDMRFRARAGELLRQLQGEPGVAGVAFESRGGADLRIEIDESGRPPSSATPLVQAERGRGHAVLTTGVAPNFFDVLDIPVLAGRTFTSADALENGTAVIVDRAFVEQLLGDGAPIGRRVRYVRRIDPDASDFERGPWLEIVGVVSDVTVQFDTRTQHIYRATTLDQLSGPLSLAIRVRTKPASAFANRLRDITVAIDPTLQLSAVQSAADAERAAQRTMRSVALGMVAATLSVLLLSAAGIYAMMSFIVVRRRREIGIRSALGADRRSILISVFSQASRQLGAGVAIGLVLAVALGPLTGDDSMLRERGLVLFPAVAALIVLVGLLATLGPARRGLSIQPTEALRAE
jgi:predicted permease